MLAILFSLVILGFVLRNFWRGYVTEKSGERTYRTDAPVYFLFMHVPFVAMGLLVLVGSLHYLYVNGFAWDL